MISRRGLLAGGGLAAAGAMLPGCGGDDEATIIPTSGASPTEDPNPAPRQGGVLRTAGSAAGTVLDVHKARSTAEALTWQWTGNQLLRFSAASPFVPELDLATAMPEAPPDGLLFTFRLRSDAKWQQRAPANGRAVTSDDVKATIDRLRALSAKSPRAGNYSNVDSVVATDPQTVQFKLKSPQADFIAIVAEQFGAVLPKELAALDEEAIKAAADVAGSGPYELTTFEPGRTAKFRRRADGYWKPGTAWLEGWDFIGSSDDGAKANSLYASTIDIAELPPALARVFEREPTFEVQRAVAPARECLLLNHATTGPLKDPRVRLAISRAVDRSRLYGAVFEGDGVSGGPVGAAAVDWALPEAELRKLPGYGDRAMELAEARKLLKEAGFEAGFDDKLVTVDAMKLPLVAEALKESLAETGIRLTVEIAGNDFAALHERFRKGEFTFGLSLLLAGLYPDAQLTLYHHSKGLANYGKYASADIDAKLDKQRGIYSHGERLALVHEIQRAIISAPGPIWLGSRQSATVTSVRVRNLRVSPLPTGFDIAENTWLKS